METEVTTFSLVCRLLVMFAMGYAAGYYMGFWGILVVIPVAMVVSWLWSKYIDRTI